MTRKDSKRNKVKKILKERLAISNLDQLTIGTSLMGKPLSHKIDQTFRFQDKFTFKSIIGYGSFGVVLLVEPISFPGELSALKIIYKQGLYPAEVNIIRNEASILQKLLG